MEIKESILVIFIFIVILSIGLIVFHRYNTESIKNAEFEYKKDKFELLLVEIPNMPELKCSKFAEENECIDIMKLEFFEGDFRDKRIVIEEVYPHDVIWILSEATGDNKLIASTPISLYDPVEDEFSIGKLIIEWYI